MFTSTKVERVIAGAVTALTFLGGFSSPARATYGGGACHNCTPAPVLATECARASRAPRLETVCQTVNQDRLFTGMKEVYQTDHRERRYTVTSPVYQTVNQERRYSVMKPVYETSMVDQSYSVGRPVTSFRQEVREFGYSARQYT